jgi:3-oxoacyl-[acyl-carrier protein] reductase
VSEVPPRNVIVTGGSRGLGLGIAIRLRDAGYRVIAVARTAGSEIEAKTGSLHFWPCDLAGIDAIPALVKNIRAEFGPIYGLVNNAGIGTSGLLANMRLADIERTVRLNTLSPIVLTKHAVRAMMAEGGKAGGGRIVNISSIVSATGFSGLAVYGATKASLVGFTKSLAREIGPLGITVNAVAPGFVDTAMTGGLEGAQREQIVRRSPLHRLAETEDVANAVAFLMSDAARNITGTVLTVDAGSTA